MANAENDVARAKQLAVQDASIVSDTSEVRSLLEFLYLDVKVRSPDEIQGLTEDKLALERKNLASVSTTQLINNIRSSIEVLLSIKNDQPQSNIINTESDREDTRIKHGGISIKSHN